VILADTSAWVEDDRVTGSQADQRLLDLISANGPLAVTQPVIMEVVAGAGSDDREADRRRLLLRFTLLDVDAAADVEAAARIHRHCCRAGVTLRGMADCLIASVALRNGPCCWRLMSTWSGWRPSSESISMTRQLELERDTRRPPHEWARVLRRSA